MASVKEQTQIASYEQTTEKAESKMELEGNFTFDFYSSIETWPYFHLVSRKHYPNCRPVFRVGLGKWSLEIS